MYVITMENLEDCSKNNQELSLSIWTVWGDNST